MSDTHAVSTTEYVVTETVIDCDGSCVLDEGMKLPTSVQWEGIPRRLAEAINRESGDLWIKPVREPAR